MNTIILTGRLTADPEVKMTTTGIPVCSFTLAVRRPMTKDTTDFLRCVAWRNTAEFVGKWFRKGKMIAVTGALTSRKFEDNNGKNHVTFEVIVDNVEFCGDKDAPAQQDAAPQQPEEQFAEVKDDDLPF